MPFDADSHLEDQFVRLLQRDCEPPWRHDVARCAPMLIRLMQDMREAPPGELAAAVHTIIAERCLVAAGAGAAGHNRAGIDRTAEVAARHLLELREANQLALAIDVPPQTFG